MNSWIKNSCQLEPVWRDYRSFPYTSLFHHSFCRVSYNVWGESTETLWYRVYYKGITILTPGTVNYCRNYGNGTRLSENGFTFGKLWEVIRQIHATFPYHTGVKQLEHLVDVYLSMTAEKFLISYYILRTLSHPCLLVYKVCKGLYLT